MRNRTLLALAVGAFMAPLFGDLLVAQGQPQQPAAPPSEQAAPQGRRGGGPGDGVQGAPAGRQGAAGRQGGRGRAAGPAAPAAPAPRNAAGRALLSGATPADKGVWIGG